MSNNQFCRQGSPRWLKALVEYGPLAIFFITYWFAGIFPATAAIVLATVIALATSYLAERHLPIMPLVMAVIVTIFGGLTLWLQNETFIKMKPTIIQLGFGIILLAGLLTDNIFLERLLGSTLQLDRKGWQILTRRFSMFFFVMAALNELIWRTQSTDYWVNFKVFGILGLTFLFFIFQIRLLKNYSIEPK